jgi:hypothetical protein
MTDDEFWGLIDVFEGRNVCDDGPYERLSANLAAGPEDRIFGFADKLAELLFGLDRRDLATVSRTPLGDDGFLYVRCAVVVAGRAAYASVLADKTAFLPFTVDAGGHADALLDVASNAYTSKTGLEWDHLEPHDFETMSNEEGWLP